MSNKVVLENGVFQLSGQIDESLDYRPLLATRGPLAIGLSGVKNVNSVGVRAFVNFMAQAGGRVELHECSPAFMDMINTFPATLGTPPRPEAIKSLVIIFSCLNCKKDATFLMGVKFTPGAVPTLTGKSCQKCRGEMLSTVEAEDLFTYMVAGD